MAKFVISCGFIVFHFFLLIATIKAQNDYVDSRNDSFCITPIGQSGECVPIRQCTVLLNLLTKKPLLPETIQFLRSSKCGMSANRGDPNVCCEKFVEYDNIDGRNDTIDDDHSAANEPTTPRVEVPNNPILPSDCGNDQTIQIYSGITRTVPAEFPWTAVLEYEGRERTPSSCMGALLNERYVLTVAFCAHPSDPVPTRVRLGEYDTSKTRDCLTVWEGGEMCADDPVSVPIEEVIAHESYGPTIGTYDHDIALLRLSLRVRFTSYIKPICLPATGEMARQLWVTGWGLTENGTVTHVKLRRQVSPVDPVECSRTYDEAGVDVGPSPLCAGSEPSDDLCGSGGSLLMSNETSPDGQQKWTLVGLVSFGPAPCRSVNWPIVHTKVIDYVPWILGRLRP